MNKIFTGIGSRTAPKECLIKIRNLSYHLALEGFLLRSGAAEGMDAFAELGVDAGGGRKEIYLPWKNFNNNPSNLYNIPEKAYEIAEKFHHNWNNLTSGAKKLMARNSMQVLGQDLKSPTDFVICYTNDGKYSGGTSQAMKIADFYGIKIYNIYHEYQYNEIRDFILNYDDE